MEVIGLFENETYYNWGKSHFAKVSIFDILLSYISRCNNWGELRKVKGYNDVTSKLDILSFFKLGKWMCEINSIDFRGSTEIISGLDFYKHNAYD